MAKANPGNGLAGHPQLRKIIDAILAGQSCREIEAWTRPRVSRSTLNRFARETVQAALEKAKPLTVTNKDENQSVTGEPEALETVRQRTKELIVAGPVLAARQNRLAAIQDRHDRMMRIVTERGDEMAEEVAGGSSGFLVRDYKGKNADTPVYKFDSALAGELREHEKHIAIELGEWQESSAAPNVAIQIVMPNAITPADASERAPVIDIALPSRPNR
jgi:hypothetical protein